jgi:hypothetical protein
VTPELPDCDRFGPEGASTESFRVRGVGEAGRYSAVRLLACCGSLYKVRLERPPHMIVMVSRIQVHADDLADFDRLTRFAPGHGERYVFDDDGPTPS